jgi:hypothetical protein
MDGVVRVCNVRDTGMTYNGADKTVKVVVKNSIVARCENTH